MTDASDQPAAPPTYRWIVRGDINATAALLLDNIAGLFLIVSILTGIFGLPSNFVLSHMIPGTAIGVFLGDAIYTWMAVRLSRRTGSLTVTAMPLGLDTPSVFGLTFFVIGPAFQAGLSEGLGTEAAALRAWHIGICCMVAAGVFKLAMVSICGWLRRSVPRAGLLGSLAAIALAIIAFVPLLDILSVPPAGLVALFVTLLTLTAGLKLPGDFPGSLAAVLLGLGIYYIMVWSGFQPPPSDLSVAWGGWDWLSALTFRWVEAIPDAIAYLPIALPFALATIIGGVDCTESAAAVGDDYRTGSIVAVEAVATLVAGLLGGVIQTTPYIGHPAYKTMGGRAGYTLATSIAMILIGISGVFSLFYQLIPPAVVYPLLVFVGLEITAQSFQATPPRHYAAIAFGCSPALAFIAVNFVDQILSDPTAIAGNVTLATLANRDLASKIELAVMLSHGLILVSLLWASILAFAIDRRLKIAGGLCGLCALATAIGLIHSPLPSNRLFLPLAEGVAGLGATWTLPAEYTQRVWMLVTGYALSAAVMLLWPIAKAGHDT